MDYQELYYEEMTKTSYKELVRLCKWFNNIYSIQPMIMGDWAVHFHHETIGSRDFGVLVSDNKLKEILINNYLLKHNYQSNGIMKREYLKDIRTPKGLEKIMVECRSVEEQNRIKGTELDIPWKIAMEYPRSIEIKTIKFVIPQVEVMLILKTKSALDRTTDLRKAYNNVIAQSSIMKDYDDILLLITKCDINNQQLKNLLSSLNFFDYFKLVFDRIKRQKDIVDKYRDYWKFTINEFLYEMDM